MPKAAAGESVVQAVAAAPARTEAKTIEPAAPPLYPAPALERTAKLTGELLLPGGSELIAGNIPSGLGTLVASSLAMAVLAPTMPVLAVFAAIGLRTNAFKHATSGRFLWDR